MWLEPEGPPDPADRGLAHARRLGHRPGRPVRGVGRTLFEGLHDHRFDPVVPDASRHPRSRLVEEATDPLDGEAFSPLAHGHRMNVELRGDLAISRTLRHAQDDARA